MDHRRKMQAFDWRRWRTLLLLVGVISAGIVLESRVFYLQVFKKDFLIFSKDFLRFSKIF